MDENVRMSKERASGAVGRLTAEDWVRAAYEAMAEGGIGAVAVEPLARRLGVTKGSFYWHFGSRGDLLEATLRRWEEEATEAVIAAVERIPDPRERLRRLVYEDYPDEASGEGGTKLFRGRAFELAVSDAVDDPAVRPVLRRVTGRRLDYLEGCYRALGFSAEDSRHRALLVYAADTGTARLAREAPDRAPRGDEQRAYLRHFAATLVPED